MKPGCPREELPLAGWGQLFQSKLSINVLFLKMNIISSKVPNYYKGFFKSKYDIFLCLRISNSFNEYFKSK